MAGQIVMEGFLNFRMRPWLRRLITRLVAITPAVVTILIAGEQATYKLLIFSQVVLSMQLPFAVIPLIHFTSDRRRMGTFANAPWVKALAWTTASIIVALNMRLVYTTVSEWLQGAGEWRGALLLLLLPLLVLLVLLLLWVVFEPVLPAFLQRRGRASAVAVPKPGDLPADLTVPPYRKLLVPLDHTRQDRAAVAHAAAIARTYSASVVLVHVEEGVTSQVYGGLSGTEEVEAGQAYLDGIAERLRAAGIEVETVIAHAEAPARAIVAVAVERKPDLVIMAAHGHRGLKDVIFGATIDDVRHRLTIPVLVVSGD
jgi:manganese transport protein